ncbi:hypothetical protein SAMN04489835_3564 [Mycolicibacterium rutilum]|uniref:Excalibur calcium-binding domain-containing protein n=1 Tax=Mycolicibacterium rutilum TaxID=370526 RepID=A0A1H6KRG1_MYCRU|nr:excalibur domain-containing protein [Mycolicibacterium rutilum]SEH74474.1 hypothetical protein SAMN04489835_3564 [Mycolicibacterium rutilum]
MGRFASLTSGFILAVALCAATTAGASGVATAHEMDFDAPLRQSSDCDSNYSGCVPVASDVDCAGGSGNGPEYVAGPITVLGDDIYELDRDGDGTACDS